MTCHMIVPTHWLHAFQCIWTLNIKFPLKPDLKSLCKYSMRHVVYQCQMHINTTVLVVCCLPVGGITQYDRWCILDV